MLKGTRQVTHPRRAAWIMSSGQPVPDRTRDISWAVQFMTVVLAALAIYGAYIRYVVAKVALSLGWAETDPG